MRTRMEYSGTAAAHRFGGRLQRSANLAEWLFGLRRGARPSALGSGSAPEKPGPPNASPPASLPEVGSAHEMQLRLPSFDGSDWTPWVGHPTLEALKSRVSASLKSYRGPALDVRLGGQPLRLDAAGLPELLAAVDRCQDSDFEPLSDFWHAMRSHDTTTVPPQSRSWPNWSMAQRLQLAAMPVIRGVAPVLPGSAAAAANTGSPNSVPVSRRAGSGAHVNGLPLNDSRWLDNLAGAAEAKPSLRIERRIESLWAWRTRWEALRERSGGRGIEFEELMRLAQGLRGGFALICLGMPHEPQTLAAIAVESIAKPFKLGERKLGEISVRQASLVGGHVLGAIDPAVLKRIFKATRALFSPDVFAIREIEIASPTHQAARQLPAPWLVTSHSRVDQLHWTIELPQSFDAYLDSLSAKTRQSVRYSQRKLAKDLRVRIEAVTRPDQVDEFLRAGELISRRTYQWQVGERLQFDEATRAEYLRRAHAGALRAYLMYVDGRPAAFVRGQLRGITYDYETPGFLPDYGRWSIGTVLMMHAIRDLIENSPCRIFDFGEGGDEIGYKSRFANRSTPVRALDVAGLGQWRGQAVLAGQGLLGLAKNLAQRILGESETKRRIKAWLRR